MRELDYVIIGQGIAGTTLAWTLRSLGQTVAVVDRDETSTASKIASGLISPVTGRRNVASWRFDELWPISKQFYEKIESQTNSRFLICQPMLKVLPEDASDLRTPARYLGQSHRLPQPLGSREAIEIKPAAQLDVPTYLNVSREFLTKESCYVVADIDPARDLEFAEDDRIRIPKHDITTHNVIFCQGIAAQSNPWFKEVEFEPAKGEILTLEIPDLAEQHVVHGDVWLAPTEDGRYLAGATYERDFNDDQPTQRGLDEILNKLAAFASVPVQVVNHRAAIRPIVRGRLPVVGIHPTKPQFGYFNGLGSKGALRAPFVAEQFAQFLVHRSATDPEIWMKRGKIEGGTPQRLTEIAHRHASNVLSEGDIAIDATAGNGFDTVFLSKTVGPSGHVFAIDIQREAIERTRARLTTECIENVTLVVGSHEHLKDLIPERHHGHISAIVFNLGYLPRGRKEVITEMQSTIAAIEQGLELLRGGGVMTILAYTGHPGGREESTAVENFVAKLPHADFESMLPLYALTSDPRLYWVRKREEQIRRTD